MFNVVELPFNYNSNFKKYNMIDFDQYWSKISFAVK